MGLIVDSSTFIAAERSRQTVAHIFRSIYSAHGVVEVAISTVTVAELVHGIYRAKDEFTRRRRELFCAEVFRDLTVWPVSFEIARLVGRIDGELGNAGYALAFEDIVIGATALHLGFGVLTLNLKHFQMIPGLEVVPAT